MITKDNFKFLLRQSGFVPDSRDNLYSKHFELTGEIGFDLQVNFEKKELLYPESYGFKINERQTCNFSDDENFVVFECVNRLFEKGYQPKHIELEPRWKLGHGASGGRADIWIKDNDGNSLLIIECKTAKKFEDAWKDTLEDGGQLFSYYWQEPTTQFLSLYASDFDDNAVKMDYRLITMRDNEEHLKSFGKNEPLSFKNADTVKKAFKAWAETYKKDFSTRGLFENDIAAYTIGKNKYSVDDLKEVSSADIQKKYHEFATILRQHNVSGHENAFDKLVNLFLSKIVDESENPQELAFYWKGAAYDDIFSLIDRLQKLYKFGMEKFLNEEVTYVGVDDINNAFKLFKNKPDATKNAILKYFRDLKYFSNNDFAFTDVHNEKLFHQNAEVLLKIVQMLQDVKLQTDNQNQFLGDLFEGFLDKGVKQSEGQYFTPMPIVKFLISSLPLEKIISDSLEIPQVIDYACGAGHFLNEYANQILPIVKQSYSTENTKITVYDPKKIKEYYAKVTGIEKEYRLSKVAKVSAFMYGQDEVKIIYADSLKKNDKLKNGTFSILVANPPYSVKGFLETLDEDSLQMYELYKNIDDKQKKTNNSIECFFVERAKQLLKSGGVAVIILPSSILSNGNIYIKMREIVLKYFDIVAIAEFGSGTFGKTGTNTATLFLRRKDENPALAEHYRNRVDYWFEGDFEKDYVFEDSHLLQKYCDKIGVAFDDYKTLFSTCHCGLDPQSPENAGDSDFRQNDGLMSYDLFKEYKKAFENSTEYRNIQKKKITAKYSETDQKTETEKAYFNYLQTIEKEKLYFFMLAESQENPVVLVKSPADNKAMKNFLGYEWSSAKGNEGIKYLGANVTDEEDVISINKGINQINTPLFNPLDLADETKINSIIRNNYELRITNYENSHPDVVSLARLSDMLDFSRVTFDKTIKTTPDKKIEIESKYPIFKVKDLCEIGRGRVISKKEIDNNPGKYPVYSSQSTNEGIFGYLNTFDFEGEYVTWTTDGIYAGSVFYRNGKFNCTNVCGTLKSISEKIEMKYLSLILPNFTKDYVVKVANPKLMNNVMAEIKIPLPPLNIQQTIVSECTKIDDEYNTCRKTIEEYKKKIAEIFEKESENKSLKIGDIGKIQMCKRIYKEETSTVGDIPFYKIGTFGGQPDAFISNNLYEEYKNKFSYPKKGSILISAAGTIGKTIVFNGEPAYFQDSNIVWIDNDESKVLNKYLQKFFETTKWEHSQGATIPRLYNDDLRNKQIPVPPLSVQREVVSEIEVYESQIAECQKIINETGEKKKAVLEKYLK